MNLLGQRQTPVTRSLFPLPLISRYLRGEFIRFFFLGLIFFVALSLLVDFFDRFNTFVKYGAPASAIARYLLFKAPVLLTQAAPAAALAGTLLSLGLLSKNREILALKACGVSPWQMARPILVSASLLSFGVWLWNEFIVPYSFHTSRYINTVEIKQKTFKGLFHERGFWYHGENAFYHIDRFDSRRNTLFGLTVYILDDHFQVQALMEIGQAAWQDGHWHFENARSSPLQRNGSSVPPGFAPLGQETPEDFALVDMKAEEFSSAQLRTHITDLQKKGLDTTEYQVDLQLKRALPFATFAMTLLGIALAVPGAKQLALPSAVGLALMIGFGYWVLLAFTLSLGHGGVLHPFLAAWLANGATCLLGIFFLLGVD